MSHHFENLARTGVTSTISTKCWLLSEGCWLLSKLIIFKISILLTIKLPLLDVQSILVYFHAVSGRGLGMLRRVQPHLHRGGSADKILHLWPFPSHRLNITLKHMSQSFSEASRHNHLLLYSHSPKSISTPNFLMSRHKTFLNNMIWYGNVLSRRFCACMFYFKYDMEYRFETLVPAWSAPSLE